MADWTNLPNTAVGVGGLPSGTTVTALRDNPVAIAEGAAGAPRVGASGLSLDAFFNTTDNSRVAFTDLDTRLVLWANVRSGDINISNDNGNTFTQVGVSFTGVYCALYFNLHTGFFVQVVSNGLGASGTITGAPFNAIETRGNSFIQYIGRGDGL
jgi:hypothetical protein